MSTLTIRGVDTHALEELRNRARSRHASMNRFVVESLHKLAFPGDPGKVREWHDLDGFFGSWSGEECREIMARCAKGRGIDAEMWQ